MKRFRGRRHQGGLTLVELMISLLLGLLVIAGAVGIFMSNRRAYAGTETLGRMQESGRVGFELMARDIREAGATPCGKNIMIGNTLTNPTANWYTDFARGLRGYDNGALAGSSAGTDAIEVYSAVSNDVQLVEYNKVSAELNVSSTSGIQEGDIAIICDYKQGSIFQITQVQTAALKLQHNPGGDASPGNCTKMFNYPVECDPPAKPKNPKVFTNGSSVAHMTAARWYVAETGNGRALFRSSLRTSGGSATAVPEQIVEGVQDMQITYLESGDAAYTDVAGVADWAKVIAVRVTLTLQAREGTEQGQYIKGTDNNLLSRPLIHTITLRNRTT